MLNRTILFLMVGLVLLPMDALAARYRCWDEPKASEVLLDADLVFTGKVYATHSVGASREELNTERTLVAFDVQKVWKGPDDLKDRVGVDVEAFYGYRFKVGDEYLVYAYQLYAPRYTMVGCPRARLLKYADKELDDLGSDFRVMKKRAASAAAPSDTSAKPQGPGAVVVTEDSEPSKAPEPVVPEKPKLDPTSPEAAFAERMGGVKRLKAYLLESSPEIRKKQLEGLIERKLVDAAMADSAIRQLLLQETVLLGTQKEFISERDLIQLLESYVTDGLFTRSEMDDVLKQFNAPAPKEPAVVEPVTTEKTQPQPVQAEDRLEDTPAQPVQPEPIPAAPTPTDPAPVDAPAVLPIIPR